jgi:hypothetical protein
MLSKTRGSETDDLVAMGCGFFAAGVLERAAQRPLESAALSDPDFITRTAQHPTGPPFQHWQWEWLPQSLTKKTVWLSVHAAKVGGDARANRGGDGPLAASAMAMPSALARQP